MASFATSYIPTGASQTTRAADVATIQGSNFYSWYNQNEGSVYANTTRASITQYAYYVSINNGVNNTINFIGWNNSTDRLSIVTNSSAEATLINSVSNTLSKTAGSFVQNNINLSTNATLATPDTLATLPIVIKFDLGKDSSGSFYLNGTIKQISYYPQRLSDSVLKGLTA